MISLWSFPKHYYTVLNITSNLFSYNGVITPLNITLMKVNLLDWHIQDQNEEANYEQ